MIVPDELLSTLESHQRDAVQSPSAVVAVQAMLEVVEGIPPISSRVRLRSRWLALVSRLLGNDVEDCPAHLEVGLLATVARTAFAARELTAATNASEQAISLAQECGEDALEAVVRARRLAFVARVDRLGAARDHQALLEACEQVPSLQDDVVVMAEVYLGRIAWNAVCDDLDAVRRCLAALGRLDLPHDSRLHFFAYATRVALAQYQLRTRKRVQAVHSLIDAARVAAELDAHPEMANIQTVLAAFAVRAGDFDAAFAHGQSAIEAAQLSRVTRRQLDPWLGMPFDVSVEKDHAGVIHHLAEAALSARDDSDRVGFLVSVMAMIAFYLLADRAPEALDTMNEAVVAVKAMDDPHASAMLRQTAEGLLRYMGMLT